MPTTIGAIRMTGLSLRLLIVLVVLPITTALPGEEPLESPAATSQTMARWVTQLDADQAEARQEAIEQLVSLAGETSLEADAFLARLPLEKATMPPSVRAGLREVRQQIERKLIESVTRASLLTLSTKRMPLAKVLEVVEEQTGNRLRDNRDNFGEDITATPLTLTANNEPFWPVIDRLLDRASLDVYPFGGRGELALVTRDEGRGARVEKATYSGPFRIEPLRVVSTVGLRDASEARLDLHLEIAWEPRLQPIALSQSHADVQVRDDLGNRLSPNQEGRVVNLEVSPSVQATEFVLALKLPSPEARSLAEVSGTLLALVPGRLRRFPFEQLTEGEDLVRSQGNATVTMQRFFKNNAIWELRMLMRLADAGDALASHRGWVFDNPSYLLTPSGERIDHVGFETTLQTEGEIGLAYLFDLEMDATGEPRDSPLDPASLQWIYESPTGVVEMPVEYFFDSIVLP